MSNYPLRTCKSCNLDFEPSSRHYDCPTCRGRRAERYSICACGNRMQVGSSTCKVCNNAVNFGVGSLSKNWRGGRTRHSRGYVLVSAPGHPRGATTSDYVFEHILVMEEKLGRYLLPKENIHHLNGVKDDNRVENLELWSRSQPAGQRVSDKVAWAREILALYSPEG